MAHEKGTNLLLAATCYERALQLDKTLFEIWIRLGDLWEQLGLTNKAWVCYGEAIAAAPNRSEPYLALARFAGKTGATTQLVALLEQAATTPQARRNPYLALGVVEEMLRVGEVEAARQRASEVAESHPELVAARVILGEIEMAAQNFSVAADHFRAATNLEPDNPRIWRRLAAAESVRSNYVSAAQAFERAASLSNDNAQDLIQAGLSYAQAGLIANAYDTLQAAVNRFPYNAEAWYRFGMVCALRGWRMEAETAFRTTLKLEPTHELARAALAELAKQAESRDSKAPTLLYVEPRGVRAAQ